MAEPSVVRGSYFDVMYGDGGIPEVFTQLCGLTTKTFTRQKNTSEHFIAKCDDPEDVPARKLLVTGSQATISGEGRFNRSQREDIEGLYDSGPNNYRFVMSEPAADNISDGYFAGSFILTNISYAGGDASDGNYATASFTFESAGAVTWTDAS